MAIFTFDQAIKKSGVTAKDVVSVGVPSINQKNTQPFGSGIADKLAQGEVNTVKALYERGKNLIADTQKAGQADQGKPLVDRVLGATSFAAKKGIETIAGGVGDIFTNMASPFISQRVKDIYKEETDIALNDIKEAWNEPGSTPEAQAGKEKLQSFITTLSNKAKDNPELTKILGDALSDVLNITSIGAGGAAEAPVRRAATQGVDTLIEGVNATRNAAGELVSTVSSKVAPAIETTKNFATGVKNVAGMTIDGAERIPSRIATNVAEKQAIREVINTLPTKVAKQAAQDGVDVADIKYLYQIPADQKAPLRELLNATKNFESGVSKTNPVEVVGKPIVERIKQLESARGTIGQELGAVAETLGTVTQKDVFPVVYAKLKSVNGLNGLKINSKGVLDFTDTVLATAETAADRAAIQNIFTNAIAEGTGKQKHLLRQELFEILGGKKKSLSNLTATQEKAYEAIRQGLSDVLDTKNSSYKALNKEYAKVAQPLQDIRKYMKGTTGADEDILNMSAGLLARRLTSMSKSNPEIRNVLRAMDEATKVKGKSTISVENLQDFYNVLDKYYDITGKTGFQGQVRAGVESASGIKDAISQTVGQIVGKTDAVKRKAIEQVLSEALM